MFLFLKYLNVFCCTKGYYHIFCHVTNVGAARLAGVLVLEQWGSHPTHEVEAWELRYVESNLVELTMGIPDTTLVEVPYHLQRHTFKFLETIGNFICKIAWAVMSYNKHNRSWDWLIEYPTMFSSILFSVAWCMGIVAQNLYDEWAWFLKILSLCTFWNYDVKTNSSIYIYIYIVLFQLLEISL